jgi:ADP-heptose:LPS heptosyltransferase
VGVSENDKLAARALVPTSAQRVFYLHPGTSIAQKELSPSDWKAILSSAFLKAASRQVSMDGVLFIVSPGDCPRHEALAIQISGALRDLLGASGQGAVLQAPKGDFRLLRGLVDRADGIICADTVVSHMACALHKPCCTHFSNPVIIPEVWQPTGSDLTQNFRILRDSAPDEPRERMAEGIARMLESVRRN